MLYWRLPPPLSLSLPLSFSFSHLILDGSRLIDNAENKVLRAFQRAFNEQLYGLRAFPLLRDSPKVVQTLNQLKQFADFDSSDVNFYLSVTKWNRLIAQYPGLEFRGFVQGVKTQSQLKIVFISYTVYIGPIL